MTQQQQQIQTQKLKQIWNFETKEKLTCGAGCTGRRKTAGNWVEIKQFKTNAILTFKIDECVKILNLPEPKLMSQFERGPN